MDQIRIGEFIAQKRKEQELTQLQFAELIGVSNKTVSKWETSSRMPDVAIIQKVCDVLKISVNELLAGEEFTEKEFIQKTEDNIIGLVQELDEIKETKTSKWLGILCGILIIIINGTFGRAYQQSIFYDQSLHFKFSMFYDAFILLYVLGMFFLMLGVTGAFTRYTAGYKCWLNKERLFVKKGKAAASYRRYFYNHIVRNGFFHTVFCNRCRRGNDEGDIPYTVGCMVYGNRRGI